MHRESIIRVALMCEDIRPVRVGNEFVGFLFIRQKQDFKSICVFFNVLTWL